MPLQFVDVVGPAIATSDEEKRESLISSHWSGFLLHVGDDLRQRVSFRVFNQNVPSE